MIWVGFVRSQITNFSPARERIMEGNSSRVVDRAIMNGRKEYAVKGGDRAMKKAGWPVCQSEKIKKRRK